MGAHLPAVQHITIHNHVHNAPANVFQAAGDIQANAIAAGGDVLAALPGWPKKWPALAPPHAFDPPRFTITLDTLSRAMASGAMNPARRAACQRGESVAVGTLLVEILKVVHAEPLERNVYVNPNRADQVLVYVPERWEVRPLLDAIQITLGRVANELAEVAPLADDETQSLAKSAGESFSAKPEAVARSSRAAMTMHLENVRMGADTWPGDCAEDDGAELREFGKERSSHLRDVPNALECALGLFSAEEYAQAIEADTARLALFHFVRLRIAGQPGNMTAVLLGAGDALVHTRRGWERRRAEQAAADLVRPLTVQVAGYLQRGPQHMRQLAEYIKAHVADLEASEAARPDLLTQSSLAAERYYSRTTSPRFAELREHIAAARAARLALLGPAPRALA